MPVKIASFLGQTSKKLQHKCFVVQHIPDTIYYRVEKPENSTQCAKPDVGVNKEEKALKTGNFRLHVYLNNIWNNNGKYF